MDAAWYAVGNSTVKWVLIEVYAFLPYIEFLVRFLEREREREIRMKLAD